MTIKEALETAQIPLLDAEVLMASVLEKSREYVIAHPDCALEEDQTSTWNAYIKRRMLHEPVAYITGEKEFYGRSFTVTPDVLIPRPSTEHLIDLTLDFLRTGKQCKAELDTDIIGIAIPLGDVTQTKTLVDVGTGSGCIAVTLKCMRPELNIIGTDIAKDALEIARKNADRSVVKIYNTQGSLLSPVQNLDEDFVVVSNPPYIPAAEKLMPDVTNYEPHQALFSGQDGGDCIRKLIVQVSAHPRCMGLVVECRKEHEDLFASMVR